MDLPRAPGGPLASLQDVQEVEHLRALGAHPSSPRGGCPGGDHAAGGRGPALLQGEPHAPVWPAAGALLQLGEAGGGRPGLRWRLGAQGVRPRAPAAAGLAPQAAACQTQALRRGRLLPRQHLPAEHVLGERGVLVLQGHELAVGLEPALLIQGVGARHDHEHGDGVDPEAHMVEVVQQDGAVPLQHQQQGGNLRDDEDAQSERVHPAHDRHNAEP
mmetsp:Transcript_112606/g.351040  ORF Transcript_112606/g.351040 Transcript_112606/m.351040 type:complete len:216 (-) Transcript_112606:582-1229(-)